MSAEALRQVFAEFGFEVDDAPLEKMVADTERAQKAEESLSKAEKKVLADARRGAAEKEKAAEKEAADARRGAAEKEKAAEKEAADAEKAAETAEKKAEEERKALLDSVPGLRMLSALKGDARMRSLGLAAGMAVVIAKAREFASAFAADVAALRESADAARVTEQQFQQLSFAGVAAGVGADTTSGALNTLAEGMRAIEARTGGPVNALWRLGVRARNADRTMRDTNDVLYDLADRFERVRSPVHRARLAQELFGASGRRMLAVLAGGSAALRRQREDFAALGGGVLPEAVEQGRRLTVAQGRMKVALDSVRSVIATSLLPVVTSLTNGVANITGWFSRMTRGSNLVSIALAAAGAAAAVMAVKFVVAWGAALAPILAAAVAVAVVGLALDDVTALLTGQPSLIGDLIARYAGFGASARFVERLREAWDSVVEALARVNAAVDRLPSWAQTGVDVATFGLRGFLPGQAGGAEGAVRPPPSAPAPRTRTSRQPRAQVVQPPMPVPTATSDPVRGFAYMPPAARVTRTTDNSMTIAPGAIVVHGRDAGEVATELMRRIRAEARQQRDGTHPQGAED